ncbi:MAG: hypothetical protein IT464_01705 [Planctomycetes bacterium]|nr:hypothetical protein [Planctomycetota bacterium]
MARRPSFYRNLDLKRALLASAPFWLAAAASQGVSAQVTHNVSTAAGLRTAITAVNNSTSNDTIILAAGTYALGSGKHDNANVSGDLDITKSAGNLTIKGAGRANTFLEATDDRAIHIVSGAAITITIEDMTIRNCDVDDDGSTSAPLNEARGGAILNKKTTSGATNTNLVLNNLIIDGCAAWGASGALPGTPGQEARGGAIYSAGGTLNINSCIVTNNRAWGGTGASGDSAGPLNGGAGGVGEGGAIYLAGGTLQVTNSDFGENYAYGGTGGTGSAGGNGGDGAIGAGGALFVAAGTVTIDNADFGGNRAWGGWGGYGASGSSSGNLGGGNGGDGGAGQGGAIYVAGGSVNIQNGSAFATNNAQGGWAGTAGSGTAGPAGGAHPGGAGGAGGAAQGGAIYVDSGTVVVSQAELSQNVADGGNSGAGGAGSSYSNSGGDGGDGGDGGAAEGGAVYARLGNTTLTECEITANECNGGWAIDPGLNNGGDGGTGWSNRGGDAGDSGDGGAARGGGVYVGQAGVIVRVERSNISGNLCQGGNGATGGDGGDGTSGGRGGHAGAGGAGGDGVGGGLFRAGGTQTLVVINSTVADNNVLPGSGGDGANGGWASGGGNGGNGGAGGNTGLASGGGVYNLNGTTQLNNATVAGNSAGNNASPGTGGNGGNGASTGAAGLAGGTLTPSGGGLVRAGGTVTASSTIIADNTATQANDVSGAVTGTNCLVEDTGGATLTGSNNITGQDPQLAPLGQNGGPTQTRAIASGSPARNAGLANSLTTDQRGAGYLRDDGNGADIGALEYQAGSGLTPPTVTSPSATVVTNGASIVIQGTAPANSLVRVYRDTNNDGDTTGDSVAGSMQLMGGSTNYSVAVPLIADSDNNFLVTADDGSGESAATDVPTVTQDSTAPATPVVTTPATAVSVTGTNFNIIGTAEADSLVQVYSDFNNNGVIDTGDSVVGSQQLTGGATAFNVSTPITQSTTNNFLVTATDAAGNESAPEDVPTITETTAPAVASPVVATPSTSVTTSSGVFNISGTAQADAMVRIYSDLNNDGFVNLGDSQVAFVQLSGGATAFTVPTPLTANSDNNFLAAAFDGISESLPTDVPTITQVPPVSGGGGGGGGSSGGGCESSSNRGPLALVGAMFVGAVAFLRRRRRSA